jgi:hypothetical protein
LIWIQPSTFNVQRKNSFIVCPELVEGVIARSGEVTEGDVAISGVSPGISFL